MTRSWLCLPLLLLGVLLLGQPAWGAQEEENQPDSGDGGQWHCCRGPAPRPLTSEEEYEERAKHDRLTLKNEEHSQFLRDYFKRKITDYFNAQNPKHFYKLYEDAEFKIKDAPGFIMEFTVYMVKTNCTRDDEELLRPSPRGRIRHYDYMGESSSAEDLSDCHPLSDEDEEIQKCTFSMYVGGQGEGGRHHVVGHRCREVKIVEESED
ncbi:Hypothetical predicted protein [Podarcis lilfordi]|uniref:Cystatin domain-containing protein n=1 Tax=Podarcis lilfordi TaxID=74358 RepID=A0AA35LL93_9SAUR|nr:Hypothetical predicted protein [Podarcis lilfordi]